MIFALESALLIGAVALTSSISVGGYVQADAILYDQSSLDEVNPSTGEPLNDNRFNIRRARLRTEAHYDFASLAFELDANTVRGPTVRIIAAEIALALAYGEDDALLLAASIGLFKIPFGYEVPERFEHRLFVEASNMANAMFPGFYDLGARFFGGWRFLRYSVAVMNGDPIAERAFPGRDPTKSKDVLGRVGVEVSPVEPLLIEAGVSALTGTGFHQGTPSTKDVIIWRDANENGLIELPELQAVAGTAGTPSSTFEHRALGADLRLHLLIYPVGELSVFGELIFAQNLDRATLPADPVALGRDLGERGFSVGFTQTFFDVAMIGLRFDRYDPDADARDQQGATLVPKNAAFSSMAIAVAWLPVESARLIAEYDHNDNALGRNAAGEPARLADDTFTVRAQLGF